jgi:hypothetical protein
MRAAVDAVVKGETAARVVDWGFAPLLYLIAWGLIGEPVPQGMMSGGPQKKNS